MSENERAERCETCRFLESIDGKIEPGYCKRYPPRTSDALLLLNAMSDIQPVVWSNDWCGEWQPIGPDLRHVGTKDAPS